MAGQAEVRSIDTLSFVKAALATFGYECGQALSEVELEGRRGVEWITVDQAGYWKAEVRRRGEKVNEAMKDLEKCRTFKSTGDGPPACTEEKKNLEKARRRLQVAEEKAGQGMTPQAAAQEGKDAADAMIDPLEELLGNGGFDFFLPSFCMRFCGAVRCLISSHPEGRGLAVG